MKTMTKAKLLGLFSGFPDRRFPQRIAERLGQALTVRDSLVFISAWPEESPRNDEDACGMHGMFAEAGMPFDRFSVIDDRTAPEEALHLVRTASCIFLMGGHAVKQYGLIRAKGIASALDVWESHVPYDGLGLTDITIKAHIRETDEALLEILKQISRAHGLPVLAMEDESAVFVQSGRADRVGQIRLIDGGRVCPLTDEMLAEMTGSI